MTYGCPEPLGYRLNDRLIRLFVLFPHGTFLELFILVIIHFCYEKDKRRGRESNPLPLKSSSVFVRLFCTAMTVFWG